MKIWSLVLGTVLAENENTDQPTYREALRLIEARSGRGWGYPVGVRNSVSYKQCSTLRVPLNAKEVKCDGATCMTICKKGFTPKGRRRITCLEDEDNKGSFQWNFKQLTACTTCDPVLPKFDDDRIIRKCKINRKTGLRQCNLKCSNGKKLDGKLSLKIRCNCPKKQGHWARQCGWAIGSSNIEDIYGVTKRTSINELHCGVKNTPKPTTTTPPPPTVEEAGASMSDPPKIELPTKPHVLFILADDLGWHDTGYHGSEILTPNIDKLANNGVKLENYYVQQSCSPTRTQLLTGRYQIRTGLQKGVIRPTQPRGIPLDEKLLPEGLKKCGYETEMFGKWHVGMFHKDYHPQNRGFDHFLGFLTGGADFWSHKKCYGKLEDVGFMCGYDFREAYSGGEETIRNDLLGIYSNDILVEGLENRLKKHNSEKPLFTYLSLQAVHAPIQAPSEYLHLYRNIRDKKRRNYAACATAMDDSIGQVVELYKEHGLWNNTIVIFSSDNGGANRAGGYNNPLRGEKSELWDGGIKSVGFVHSNLLPENRIGKESFNLMHVTDWLPTLLDFGGCDNEFGGKPLDGVSQLKTIWTDIEDRYQTKNEILHYMNPLLYTVGSEDPRGDWKNDHGGPLKERCFSINVRAVIRVGKWKLHTGLGSKEGDTESNWKQPPTRLFDGARSIFDTVELPDSAFDNDMRTLGFCGDECDDRVLPLPLPECFGANGRNIASYSTTSFFDGRGQSATEMQLSRTASERQNLGKLKFLKLYDMEADPNEIKDVSEENPEIVNQLLLKLADYYDEQVTPWFPAEEKESNPKNFDGIWKAWHM